MNDIHLSKIAQELTLTPKQVEAAASLLEEGGTIPFIARYRKEATGSLDEVARSEHHAAAAGYQVFLPGCRIIIGMCRCVPAL